MAVTSFAADSVVDAIVTNLRAATGFKAPTESGTDVPVYDGAVVSSASALSCVIVAGDGDQGVQRPYRFTHEWHDMDLTTRESGQVQCAVLVWSGDSDPSALGDQRGTAVGILTDVDEALRASISAAALGVTQLLWSKVDSGELIQASTDRGTETRLTFVYGYEALLQVT